eukprot:9850445-Prorocentrum_lima.AAC.1
MKGWGWVWGEQEEPPRTWHQWPLEAQKTPRKGRGQRASSVRRARASTSWSHRCCSRYRRCFDDRLDENVCRGGGAY